MPIDRFFTSKWKSKPYQSTIISAKMKRSWPVAGQFKPEKDEAVKLWMRQEGSDQWCHVRNLSSSEARDEKEAWAGSNCGWEFKLTVRRDREHPIQKKFGSQSKTGY